MSEVDPLLTELRRASKALIDSINYDVNGILLPTGFQGGHGGLVSNDTIARADTVRRILSKLPPEEKK